MNIDDIAKEYYETFNKMGWTWFKEDTVTADMIAETIKSHIKKIEKQKCSYISSGRIIVFKVPEDESYVVALDDNEIDDECYN